jgi:hypothetical protein
MLLLWVVGMKYEAFWDLPAIPEDKSSDAISGHGDSITFALSS